LLPANNSNQVFLTMFSSLMFPLKCFKDFFFLNVIIFLPWSFCFETACVVVQIWLSDVFFALLSLRFKLHVLLVRQDSTTTQFAIQCLLIFNFKVIQKLFISKWVIIFCENLSKTKTRNPTFPKITTKEISDIIRYVKNE
jgi:hypothetical protein